MSLDEFARRKGQGKFATILTDLDKSSLLEVIDSHKSDDIITVLKQQPLAMRQGVEGSPWFMGKIPLSLHFPLVLISIFGD